MPNLVNKQQGFTLIELIMVIVILGVLAAFAVPKFADLSDAARDAVLEGGKASITSASAIAHAASLATGNAKAITLEGNEYELIYSYPSRNSILQLAGIEDSDFTVFQDSEANRVWIMAAGSISDVNQCFSYSEANGPRSAPIISPLGTWVDGGQLNGTLDNDGDTCAGLVVN